MNRDLRSRNSKATGRPTHNEQGNPSAELPIASQAASAEDTATNYKAVPRQSGNVSKAKGVTPAKRRKIYDIFEDAEAVLRNDDSPLYDKVSLKNVLSHPKAVEALADSGLEFSALKSDALSSTVALFKEDGVFGRFDPVWLSEAHEAGVSRSSGATAKYEEDRFNATWGTDDEALTDSEDDSDCPYDDGDSDDDDSDDTPDERRNKNHRTEMATARDHDDEPRGAWQDDRAPDPIRDMLPNIPSTHAARTHPEDDRIKIWYAPRTQIKARRSYIKMDPLFRGQRKVLIDWDVVRYNASNGLFKEATIKLVRGSRYSYVCRVPPGQLAISNLSVGPDVEYPQPGGNVITGCADIHQCMVSEDPRIPNMPRAKYQDIMVKRNGRELGTLFELRQAFEFRMAEEDFYNQLNFSMEGRKQLSMEHVHEGYHCIGSCLYRKIRRVDLPFHNPNLIIDLGDELNAQLAACAEPGYTIVMIDSRILRNDGIAGPHGVKKQELENALRNGPDAFTTEFTRAVAGWYGYSRGHAHIGPLGLTKGYGQPIWNHGDGCPFSSERPKRFRTASEIAESDGCKIWDNAREARQYYHNQKIRSDPAHYPRFGFISHTYAPHNRLSHTRRDSPRSVWLDTSKVPAELTPPGSLMTLIEQIKIRHFQEQHLSGKIVHRPVPCTMADRLLSSPTPGQHPMQLAAADERVHEYDEQHGYKSQVNRLVLGIWSNNITLDGIVNEVAAGKVSVLDAKRSCIFAFGYVDPAFDIQLDSLNVPIIPQADAGVELPPMPDLTHVPEEFVANPTPEQLEALDNWAEYMNHPLYPKWGPVNENMADQTMAGMADETVAGHNMADYNMADYSMADHNKSDHNIAGQALPIEQSHGLARGTPTYEPLDFPNPSTSYLDPRLASDNSGMHASTANNAAPVRAESPVSPSREEYGVSMARAGLALLSSFAADSPAPEPAHYPVSSFTSSYLDNAAAAVAAASQSNLYRFAADSTARGPVDYLASSSTWSYVRDTPAASQPSINRFTADSADLEPAHYPVRSFTSSYLGHDAATNQSSMYRSTADGTAPGPANSLASSRPLFYPDPTGRSMHNFTADNAPPGDDLYPGSERSFGPAADHPDLGTARSYPPKHPSAPMDRQDSGYATGCDSAPKSRRGRGKK